uniref:Uncharacterized protein n=1 Tax=Spongospora subterranea TaxID=70186 RepID=A0A0H5QWG1_9EUKA|eukprot:CRZ05964.1 hypothetical protein [Spongospora subterranea]
MLPVLMRVVTWFIVRAISLNSAFRPKTAVEKGLGLGEQQRWTTARGLAIEDKIDDIEHELSIKYFNCFKTMARDKHGHDVGRGDTPDLVEPFVIIALPQTGANGLRSGIVTDLKNEHINLNCYCSFSQC